MDLDTASFGDLQGTQFSGIKMEVHFHLKNTFPGGIRNRRIRFGYNLWFASHPSPPPLIPRCRQLILDLNLFMYYHGLHAIFIITCTLIERNPPPQGVFCLLCSLITVTSRREISHTRLLIREHSK